jgi:hypothetical protein
VGGFEPIFGHWRLSVVKVFYECRFGPVHKRSVLKTEEFGAEGVFVLLLRRFDFVAHLILLEMGLLPLVNSGHVVIDASERLLLTNGYYPSLYCVLVGCLKFVKFRMLKGRLTITPVVEPAVVGACDLWASSL